MKPTGLVALTLLLHQLFEQPIRAPGPGGGAGLSARLGAGWGSPGMLGWSWGFLCSEEGSDQCPELTRGDFSGTSVAARSSWR